MGTHYDVLGLQPSATDDEIEDQYRALAKVVHPDRGGDAITFMVLTESYDVLSDPVRRAEYDRSLAAPAHRRPLAPPLPPDPPPTAPGCLPTPRRLTRGEYRRLRRRGLLFDLSALAIMLIVLLIVSLVAR